MDVNLQKRPVANVLYLAQAVFLLVTHPNVKLEKKSSPTRRETSEACAKEPLTSAEKEAFIKTSAENSTGGAHASRIRVKRDYREQQEILDWNSASSYNLTQAVLASPRGRQGLNSRVRFLLSYPPAHSAAWMPSKPVFFPSSAPPSPSRVIIRLLAPIIRLVLCLPLQNEIHRHVLPVLAGLVILYKLHCCNDGLLGCYLLGANPLIVSRVEYGGLGEEKCGGSGYNVASSVGRIVVVNLIPRSLRVLRSLSHHHDNPASVSVKLHSTMKPGAAKNNARLYAPPPPTSCSYSRRAGSYIHCARAPSYDFRTYPRDDAPELNTTNTPPATSASGNHPRMNFSASETRGFDYDFGRAETAGDVIVFGAGFGTSDTRGFRRADLPAEASTFRYIIDFAVNTS
ncbi:hypothetical protein C8R44DRAFT_891300 [Mycena epipterygia]|nr:hypothetical protein C8R44DRAFT_891300 [Mycena epipterygia]